MARNGKSGRANGVRRCDTRAGDADAFLAAAAAAAARIDRGVRRRPRNGPRDADAAPTPQNGAAARATGPRRSSAAAAVNWRRLPAPRHRFLSSFFFASVDH